MGAAVGTRELRRGPMKAFNAVVRIVMIGVSVAIAGSAAGQQVYPNKPIRLIVPYPPGGGSNVLARLVGQKFSESWGQQVIVDNRPGGNTIIGTEAAAKSPPDGYTILVMSSSHVIIPLLLPTPYDIIKDFAPVATLTRTEFILVAHPSLHANNLQEFIALAKSRPGQLNYASSGSGTVTHLAGEFFNILAEVKLQHVPYKGGGPAITDLIGGQVQLAFQVPTAAISYVKGGRLKAIAISGETRLSALPQVPTFAEAGLPGFDVKGWFAVLAPVGISKAVIDKLSAEIAKILEMPDIKEKIVSEGLDTFISTPDQFATLMKIDMAKWAKVIKTANIKLEN